MKHKLFLVILTELNNWYNSENGHCFRISFKGCSINLLQCPTCTKKWTLFASCRPPSQKLNYFLDEKQIYHHERSLCQRFIASDLSIRRKARKIKSCVEIPKCTDLILTNKHFLLKNSKKDSIQGCGFIKRGPK